MDRWQWSQSEDLTEHERNERLAFRAKIREANVILGCLGKKRERQFGLESLTTGKMTKSLKNVKNDKCIL